MSELAWLFIHLFSTLIMVGIIWFVQLVHYPLMALVGTKQFRRYSQLHQSRTTLVVVGPMIVEALSAILLFLWFPLLRSSPIFGTACVLLALIWASTACWQVPLHQSLALGHDDLQVRRLVRSNWFRTVAWSVRGVLISTMFWSSIENFVRST